MGNSGARASCVTVQPIQCHQQKGRMKMFFSWRHDNIVNYYFTRNTISTL